MEDDLQNLSTDQLRDLLDAKVEIVGSSAYDPERFEYFEDMEAYGRALAAIGKDPAVSIPHELAHGRCALAVGVVGVQYGIEYTIWGHQGVRDRIPYRAVTSLLGLSRIPRLGLAAISAAPQSPSQGDLNNMRSLGYRSLEYLAERITKWNRHNGLIIPLPGTIDTSF